MLRYFAWQVRWTQDRDAAVDNGFVGAGQLAVAASLRRQIHDHGAPGHLADGFGRNQQWRAAAGDGGRRDDDVALADDLSELHALPLLLLGREGLGVAAFVFGACRVEVELDKLGAEAFDLLLY